MKVQGSIAQNTCQTAKKFRQVTNLTKASTDLFHPSIRLQCTINPNKCQLDLLPIVKFCVILLIIGSCRQREYKGNTAQKKVPNTAECDIINL